MQYYKVNAGSDQTRANVKFKDSVLIANELYTPAEVTRYPLPPDFVGKHFTKIDISKKAVYFFFGARFQTKQSQSK